MFSLAAPRAKPVSSRLCFSIDEIDLGRRIMLRNRGGQVKAASARLAPAGQEPLEQLGSGYLPRVAIRRRGFEFFFDLFGIDAVDLEQLRFNRARVGSFAVHVDEELRIGSIQEKHSYRETGGELIAGDFEVD